MPSPLKERPAGRLGRLLAALRPARAGPLPVQTGFPTSLADLVVKNHGRLKKPSASASRRKKRGGPEAPPSPSPSPSPSPPPQPSSPPPPPPSPPPAAAVSVSPPTQPRPRPELPPVEAVLRRQPKGRVFGLGLGFVSLVGVVSLALLVIWSKKVVAAVTVASFSLFLLESVRSSALSRRPRRPAANNKLDLDGRGYVSPIREVEPARASFSDSSRRSEFSILTIEERSEVGDDSIVAIEERIAAGGDDSSNAKVKTKKRSWRKLIPRKLQKGMKGKEAEDSSGSFRSSEGNRGDATATDSSDSRRGMRTKAADAFVARSMDSSPSFRGNGGDTDADAYSNATRVEIDAPADVLAGDGDAVGGTRSSVALLVVAVVLVGLVAGKLPAVVFTVLCGVFISSVQRLPAGGDGNGDRSFTWWFRIKPKDVN
ncbi:hypothetical protein EE612_019444 [Oryza sativa]|uniref:Uncharacterized protein n=1 Tax=Oryza sativa subsp. indica TaxID=39946 RepID=A2XKB1_ORYSI|nr:hypothetical protein OsI_12887 [Oryza sativa Indica Group]KAB8092887.1 hypothetical protein EE612_019444 [Oryza sativa]